MANYSYVKNARFGYLGITGTSVLQAPSNMQLLIDSLACVNGSSGSEDIGIGYTLSPTRSAVFTANGGAATAFSSGAILQAVGRQLYFQADQIFDFIPMLLSTSASAETPTYVVQYWNGAWTTIAAQNVPIFTGSSEAIIINPPLDWIVGAGGISGLSTSRYSLRITASAVQVTTPIASSILPSVFLLYREEVETKQALEVNFDRNQFLMEQGQKIIPYFSVADNSNSVELGYKINP